MIRVRGFQKSLIFLVVSLPTRCLRSQFPLIGATTWECRSILVVLRFLLGTPFKWLGLCWPRGPRLFGFGELVSISGLDSSFRKLYEIDFLLDLCLGIRVWRFHRIIRFVGCRLNQLSIRYSIAQEHVLQFGRWMEDSLRGGIVVLSFLPSQGQLDELRRAIWLGLVGGHTWSIRFGYLEMT